MTDEELKHLAEKYIETRDIVAVAMEFHLTDLQVRRLLKMAKASFPELDWPVISRGPRKSMTKYVEMKDGKPGTRGVPQGSIIKGRK